MAYPIGDRPALSGITAEVIDFPKSRISNEYWIEKMDRINQYRFYEIGSAFKLLAEQRGEIARRDGFWPVFNAESALKQLLSGDPVALGVSRPAAMDLGKSIESVMKRHFRDKDGKFRPLSEDGTIQEWEWEWLRGALQTFEHVFSAEMQAAATYNVPKRGLYSVPILVDEADGAFPTELSAFISDKTRSDFRAAGRCLAFNLPTASGFHAVRSVEAMIEDYYGFFTGNPGATLNSWHDYIKELEKPGVAGASPAPLTKTLNLLKQIKDLDRNPVVHPRVTLSDIDARVLFSTSESAILAMAQEIKTAKAGTQTALQLVAGTASTP